MWPRFSLTAVRRLTFSLRSSAYSSWRTVIASHSVTFCNGAVGTHGGSSANHTSAAATEVLEVELLSPHEADASSGLPEGDEDFDSLPDEEVYEAKKEGMAETITVVDTFARAKVGNFIKRILGDGSNSAEAPAASSSQLNFEVREVQTSGGDDDKLFHARLCLPLPLAYGERWAEGLAPTSKEAENVAAMHAERIIDALGFPMFLLTSKQQRHAAAARKAGRWAPMPGETTLPPDTPSPPRLQLVREGAMKVVERQLQIDKLTFSSVTSGTFTPMRLTLASPFLLDHGSVYRVKQFFASYNCPIQRYCRITAVHKCVNKVESFDGTTASTAPLSPTTAAASTSRDGEEIGKKIFVAQIRLPIDIRFGDRIACGKAPTKKEAYALACMHAELIIDALGLALYPFDREKQEIHAAECHKVNRWCCGPTDQEYHYNKPSPPPLQLAVEADGVVSAAVADSSLSVESLLMSHAKAVESFTHITELESLVLTARRDFLDYMTQHNSGGAGALSPFFVEVLGVKDHHVYRATVTVPVKPVTALETNNMLGGAECGDSTVLPSFVAIGIGTSELEAEISASMHALCVLGQLNRLGCTQTNRNAASGGEVAQKNLTSSTVIPPPYRYVVGHIGRIMVPGLSCARSLSHRSVSPHKDEASARMHEETLQRARTELPRRDWSLEADVGGFIIVSPHTRVEDGRNYVHTLPSVRQMDRFAVVRLRDYLERHGKRLEAAVKTTVVTEEEHGLKRWVSKVSLPVPAAFKGAVAHGEAYTEEEALVMCAVHAELVLDEMGVALYDLDALQRKHRDAAAMLGRWAPSGTSLMRANACLPPPVRKERADSFLWMRLNKDVSRKEHLASSFDDELNEVSASVPSEEVGALCEMTAPPTISASEEADDVLCDLSKLVSIHPSDIFQHAPRVLDVYCKRKGIDIYRIVRQYNVSSPPYGYVHRAIMEIPVPSQFGRRHAIGCASTKKEAFTLCCMHAVLTLGELGIPIYTGPKQAEFATLARSKGRKAPGPGDPMQPPSTESPPGLKSLQDVFMERPLVPNAPERAECRNPFVWSSYVTACRSYIKKSKEHATYDAVLNKKKAPRSGVAIEDNGLDIVEPLPLFSNAKSKLPQKCAAAGLPPPPANSFRFEICGKNPQRRYIVEQPVSGTPFVARGVGDVGYEAVTRAAMHYEYIVGVIGNSAHHCKAGTKFIATHSRGGDLFDSATRDFTPRGKLSVIVLHTMLRPPFKPVRSLIKERGGTGSPVQTTLITLMEVEDESGLRLTGKGECGGNMEEARNKAISELFKQLQKKSAFQATAQFLRSNPSLRAEGSVHMVSEGRVMKPLRILFSDPKYSVPPPLSDFQELGAESMRLIDGGGDYFDSAELQMLLEMVRRQFGSSRVPAPLSLPAATRQLFSSMGLTSADGSGRDAKSDRGEANRMAVVLAFLSTCIPPPSIARSSRQSSVSCALPLQLAKLLLAGCLMDCQSLCINVAAVILSFLDSGGREGSKGSNYSSQKGGDVWKGLDLMEHAMRPLDAGEERFADIITSRLHGLLEQLKRCAPASDSLLALLSSTLPLKPGVQWREHANQLSSSQIARLRLAIAFATFPRVFIQKRAVVAEEVGLVMVKSRDQQRRLHIRVPTSLAVPHFPSYSVKGQDREEQATVNAVFQLSSLPCFCAFDGIASQASSSSTLSHTIFGAFVSPCSLLLSTACCDDARTFSIADDLPGMALIDGFVPVVMQAPESLSVLVELRLLLRWYWGSLRPLPPQVQGLLDDLLSSEHSLTHVAQGGLLD
ncbi:hypothetical protein ERJ75_001622700 [Trypanosoma vivax]|uniref:REH2 DRSM domain-containing protein n=1 Tax=Trypanosoma vivax (strain Y486) TaxID=1055687 RepID=G0TT90_TRYVY|nr:hypothetical protein ERJ75_001622700 [Trypanosoma vivax]CCC47171.1 conserved hypothetical protein [Trypanosoma vivax Y486]